MMPHRPEVSVRGKDCGKSRRSSLISSLRSSTQYLFCLIVPALTSKIEIHRTSQYVDFVLITSQISLLRDVELGQERRIHFDFFLKSDRTHLSSFMSDSNSLTQAFLYALRVCLENSTLSTTHPNPPSDSHNSMVVSINGGFEIQSEDDYTAKRSAKSPSPKSSDEENGKSSGKVKKLSFLPTPPADEKGDDSSPKSQAPHRSFPPAVRPKSSDTLGRSENGTSATSKSLSDPKTKTDGKGQARAKRWGRATFIPSIYELPFTCSVRVFLKLWRRSTRSEWLMFLLLLCVVHAIYR